MNRKITLTQDSESLYWHWIILEYSEKDEVWFNIASGLEESYEIACIKAKESIDKQ